MATAITKRKSKPLAKITPKNKEMIKKVGKMTLGTFATTNLSGFAGRAAANTTSSTLIGNVVSIATGAGITYGGLRYKQEDFAMGAAVATLTNILNLIT